MLAGKRILLVITGSIAAYKSLELTRLFIKSGASVEGILTDGGAQFVTPLSLGTLTGKRVHQKMWDQYSYEMNHIELSRRCDIIVIAPGTAGFVAKMANGIGDDLASSVMLARNKPVIIAPSMNVEMWENPAFRRNLAQIKEDGVTVIEPQLDLLACGEKGMGKMAEPEMIFSKVHGFLTESETLENVKAVVTTGGTIERIDGVRYLSNFSSGKQGNQIALALAEKGCLVTLIVGNVQETPPQHRNIQTISVESAEQMKDAVHAELPSDIFVSCAAVCDFKVANRSTSKIKKQSGLNLTFEENPDILQSVGQLPESKRPKVVIGFAAETDDLIEYAKAKLKKKGCDLIVANDVSNNAIFGKDDTLVNFITAEENLEFPEMTKAQAAQEIVNWATEAIARDEES